MTRTKKTSVETVAATEVVEAAKPVRKTRTTRKKAVKPAENIEKTADDGVEPEKASRTTKAKTPRKSKAKDENLALSTENKETEQLVVEPQATVPSEESNNYTSLGGRQGGAPIKFVKPTKVIHDLVELSQAPIRQIVLSDLQIQQLTLEQAEERHLYLEQTLARVLDYDVVLSDTNIWLELLVGKTSSNSDPRFNARLQFERQLEFISKMTRFRKGKFIMMAETYEEIDRFATQQEPTDYKDADFSDQTVCLNAAARLAKRLILSQQRENRLRIEGIGAESHHSAFADPAIIRRTVEFFAQGKKVLLITNDASVAIRSMGLCDDLQRFNNIDDETWERDYAPLRPMACTFDDLKMLDQYTRQYHFIQQAAGKQWMEDIPQEREKHNVEPLKLWMEAFRPGDRHRQEQPKMPTQQQKQAQPKKQQPKQQPQPKPEQKEQKAEEVKPVVEETKEEEQPKAEEQKPKRRPQRRGRRKSSANGEQKPADSTTTAE